MVQRMLSPVDLEAKTFHIFWRGFHPKRANATAVEHSVRQEKCLNNNNNDVVADDAPIQHTHIIRQTKSFSITHKKSFAPSNVQ